MQIETTCQDAALLIYMYQSLEAGIAKAIATV